MRISKTELNRWEMPSILVRLKHTKEVIIGIWKKNYQFSNKFYLYHIKKEMLQVRKHITLMDEYIRRFERSIK